MKYRAKINLVIILTIIVFIAISAIAGYLFSKKQKTPTLPPTQVEEPPSLLPEQEFDTEAYRLEDEGITFELIDGWELEHHKPEQQVDRYRFKKITDPKTVLTFSFYDKVDNNPQTFDDLMERRYGAAYLNKVEDTQIGDLPAKRVYIGLMEETTGADVLIELNDNTFLSIYGLHVPSGEVGILTAQQIDYMQQSVKVDSEA